LTRVSRRHSLGTEALRQSTERRREPYAKAGPAIDAGRYALVSILPEDGRRFFGYRGLKGYRGRTGWATHFQLPRAERTENLLELFGQDPVAQFA
jgi:hypothetical protein